MVIEPSKTHLLPIYFNHNFESISQYRVSKLEIISFFPFDSGSFQEKETL